MRINPGLEFFGRRLGRTIDTTGDNFREGALAGDEVRIVEDGCRRGGNDAEQTTDQPSGFRTYC